MQDNPNFIPGGPYGVIVADPPWRYSFSRSDSRKIENHYATMTQEEICGLDIPAADNSVLYLWATAPKLLEALEVMKAWGFKYTTQAIWDKKLIGMGYWFRGVHEIILVGKKGKFSPPPVQFRIPSILVEKRTRHSKKPGLLQVHLDEAYPQHNRLEMFARTARPGWTSWGNEITTEMETT